MDTEKALAEAVDAVLGNKVLGNPDELWKHIECIHGAGHALGVEVICTAMAQLAEAVCGASNEDVFPLMSEFVEVQGDVLRDWLRERGITKHTPWIMHETNEGIVYFVQWSIET